MAERKRKVLKPRQWASEQPVTVYLEAVPALRARRYRVYKKDGSYLGFIESYRGSIDTHVPGTRLRRQGKRRTFWAANGINLWRQHPSQADAIRELLGR